MVVAVVVVDCTKRGLKRIYRRGWRIVGGRGIVGFGRIAGAFGRFVGRSCLAFVFAFARGSRTVGRRVGNVVAGLAGFGIAKSMGLGLVVVARMAGAVVGSSMGLGIVAAALSMASMLVGAVEAVAVRMIAAGRTVVDLVVVGILVVVQAVDWAVAGTMFVRTDSRFLNCQAQRSDFARISKTDYLDSKEMTLIGTVVAVRRKSCIAQVSAASVEV
jgi:hypothetical protein